MALILIIDDAAFSRRMIRKALQAKGYEILEATNGGEGLEMAHTHNPDLILTDLLDKKKWKMRLKIFLFISIM